MDFVESDVEAAVRVLHLVAEQQRAGNMRAFPQFPGNPNADLYTAHKMVSQEPAIEAVIWDKANGNYCLAKREPGQTDFGIGRVHIFGGFMKPVGEDIDPVTYARRTAMMELGIALEYLAGPVFSYSWQPDEHKGKGHPLSLGYVFRIMSGDPDTSKVRWYKIGEVPTRDEMILDRAGELHFMFLRAFFRWVDAGGHIPCIDLNENPM